MRRMKNILFTFFLLCCSLLPGYAGEEISLYNAGNDAYKSGNYELAIENYENLLKQGVEAADIYYNLGNAYFKTNKVALSILNYERCLKLTPNHQDAIQNLKTANLKVVDFVQPLPELLFERWRDEMLNSRSSTQWSILAIVMLWISLFMGGIFLYSNTPWVRRSTFIAGFLTLSLSVVSLGMGFGKRTMERSEQFAIVQQENIYVKSAPNDQSTDLFILHEGTKTMILTAEANWCKIQLADGKTGWISKAAIVII